MSKTLYYAHDPMCSWCWGFRPAWEKLQALLPDTIQVVKLLGGLAPDSEQPMPQSMQQYLQQTWLQIEQRIPGTRFNHAFWQQCQPRRSTYPACRAVLTAALWHRADAMTEAIQHAYYLEAKNPSDEATLVGLAKSLAIDPVAFTERLSSEQIRIELARQLDCCQELGVRGFPSLVLQQGSKKLPVSIHYTDPQAMLEQCTVLLGD
ncbi:MAG TPA: DsbA family protein [Gammaproteobacteria bacterium]|nr:DsbA family protein [Gammaproteobacteria bacterium]